MKNKLVFLLIISFFIACQKEIEVEYPKLESKLVINSLFTPDSLFKVRVTKSSGMNNTLDDIVQDAACEIWSNNQLLETLRYTKNGFYISELLKPDVGKSYTIKVSHPNFKMATATSYVPTKTSFSIIDTVNFEEVDYLNETCFFGTTLQFDEEKQQDNFYEIIVKDIKYKNRKKENLDYERYVRRYKSKDIIIQNEEIIEYNPNTIIFSDKKITKQTCDLKFSFELGVLYTYPKGIYRHNAVVYFVSASQDYYKYKKHLIKHKANQQSNIWNGAGDPVVMFTNVENGYGIFAGYQISLDTIFY